MNSNQNDDQKQQGVVQPTAPQQGAVQQGDDQEVPNSQIPASSTTPHGKEAGPVSTQQGEVQDYIEPAAHEAEPDLPQEVENAGVEVTPDQQAVQLTEDQKAAGITPANEATAIPVDSQGTVQAPMTYQQAEEAAGGKADDQKTWLGKLIVFAFGQKQHTKEHY